MIRFRISHSILGCKDIPFGAAISLSLKKFCFAKMFASLLISIYILLLNTIFWT
jgi:hypothetical protein